MASWTSPVHFQVRAACRTGTKHRTVVQREDEKKWEWVISQKEAVQSAGSSDARPVQEAASSTAAKSAGSGRMRPEKEKWERISSRTEAASNTGAKSARSDDKRPDKRQFWTGPWREVLRPIWCRSLARCHSSTQLSRSLKSRRASPIPLIFKLS